MHLITFTINSLHLLSVHYIYYQFIIFTIFHYICCQFITFTISSLQFIAGPHKSLLVFSKTALMIFFVFGLKLVLNMTFNSNEADFSEKFSIWRKLPENHRKCLFSHYCLQISSKMDTLNFFSKKWLQRFSSFLAWS